jgi:predicted TIM-barrel fold metal-dependent hydrolase
MLIIRAMDNVPDQAIKKGDEFRLYIVDAHHHMGREGSHKNTPPGAYEFYAQLWFELQKKSETRINHDELLFEPVRIDSPIYQGQCFASKAHWDRMNHGWLVDRTIVFPFTDDYYRTDYPHSPSFQVSNDKIASWTTRAPHSTRLIGFSRIDPNDALTISEKAPIKELERAILQLGLRGLKLHPLAQLFLDEIEGQTTKTIIQKTKELGIPVLFDTRNVKTVLRIKALIDSVREDNPTLDSKNGFSVILAHCGMSPGDTRLYDVLNDPLIFADTSTLHGKDVPLLFSTAKERIGMSDDYWSQKLLFGTDYSFLSVQAIDVILHLLSRDFQGTLADTQRILGGNALQLVQKPFRTKQKSKLLSKRIVVQHEASAIGLMILKSILSSSWEIASLDYMHPPNGTWPQPKKLASGGYNGIHLDSFLATLVSQNNKAQLHLWFQSHPNDYVSCTIISTSDDLSMKSCELAVQRIDPAMMKKLSNQELLVNSEKQLISKLQAILHI